MFKKFKVLSAPFSICATSLILAVTMILPGSSYPSRDVIALSTQSTADSAIVSLTAESAGEEAETEQQATGETGKRNPEIADAVNAYAESAPPSVASALSDQTPKLEQEIREESAAAPDEPSELPTGKMILYALTDEEYEMLCWCVEGEARGKSLKHREIIVQVIMNRVFNDRFPNTVKGVLTAPNQFVPMGWFARGYSIKLVSPLSIEAVNAVMDGEVEDMSQGALYFCNPSIAHGVEWFENALVTLFDLENHRFYTTKSGK